MRAVNAMLGALALAGCGHSEPFGSLPREPGLFSGDEGRMTYGGRENRLVSHSASGDEVYYSFCEDRKAELQTPCGEPSPGGGQANPGGDRCLGALPAAGGGRLLELCGTPDGDADSIKQFLAGTRLADGSLVYVYLARRWTASFSANPALYLRRPGTVSPLRIHQFPVLPSDGGVPRRLIPAGPDAVLALGGGVPTVFTIPPGGEVTVREIPGAVAADAGTGRVARWIGLALVLEELATGASRTVAIPELGWAHVETGSVSIGRDAVAIVQRQLDPEAMEPNGMARVLLIREGREPIVVPLGRDLQWGSASLAPDGRSLVIEQSGDLHRFRVPS